jgi:hypothetical protein
LDSQSLRPVLLNQNPTRSRVYAEQFDSSLPTTGGRVLRDARYKIIRYHTGSDAFYDLQTDPSEITNLLANGVTAMSATQQSSYYRLKFEIARFSSAISPAIETVARQGGQLAVSVVRHASIPQTLWRCTDLTGGYWAPVPGATSSVQGAYLLFTDPAPPSMRAFYSVVTDSP